MTERRPWTEEEDRLLKHVFETTKLSKWSHIARILQEDYGVKGRNGKQCKERYTTHIDTSHPKDDWGYDQEQEMFKLHNELGNKWAVIGSKLGGKSDNCVKNHFYSLLRKALRKMNKVVLQEFRKQLKEIKPNVLYRIVEVSEQRFKLSPNFEKEFICFSNQLKNQLLEFSYDQDDEEEVEVNQLEVEQAKKHIEKVGEFNLNYKKRVKKQRKSSGQYPDLLTPTRYPVKKCHSENDEECNSSFCNSEDLVNGQFLGCEDEVCRSTNSTNKDKKRRNSADTTTQNILEAPRIRTRAASIDNRKSAEKEDEEDVKRSLNVERSGSMEVEELLNGLQILQEDENLPPHPLMMKKDTSKYSRYSENLAEREEYQHFFEESNIQMRILPEMTLVARESEYQGNIFH